LPSRQRKAELRAETDDVDAAQAEQILYSEAPH